MKEIFKVQGEVVPVTIIFSDLPVYNPRYTWRECRGYIGLSIKKYVKNGEERWYLNAIRSYEVRWSNSTVSGVLPDGAIVYISYHTGSSKHVYHEYSAIFIVKKGEQSTVELRDEKGDKNIKAEITNLQLLQFIGDQKTMELKAELLNKGWIPSRYDPVITLYHYFIKVGQRTTAEEQALTLTFKIKTVEDIDAAIQRLKELREKMVSMPGRVKSLLKSMECQ